MQEPGYPRGWVTVHAGLSKYVYREIGEKVQNNFIVLDLNNSLDVRFFADGDDWNVWGEPPTGHARHVQWATPFLAIAMDLRTHLTTVYADDLIPLDTGDDSYTTVIISGSEDWASGNDLTNLLNAHDFNIKEK